MKKHWTINSKWSQNYKNQYWEESVQRKCIFVCQCKTESGRYNSVVRCKSIFKVSQSHNSFSSEELWTLISCRKFFQMLIVHVQKKSHFSQKIWPEYTQFDDQSTVKNVLYWSRKERDRKQMRWRLCCVSRRADSQQSRYIVCLMLNAH